MTRLNDDEFHENFNNEKPPTRSSEYQIKDLARASMPIKLVLVVILIVIHHSVEHSLTPNNLVELTDSVA